MDKILRIAGAAVACALMAFSCVSGRTEPQRGSDGRGGPGPGVSGGQGPSEADMSLLRLKGLVDCAQAELAITKEQATAILPILKDWKSKARSLSGSDAKTYAASIDAALSEAQKAYRPEPPKGMGQGGPGGDGQPAGAPPQGRPQDGPLEGQPSQGAAGGPPQAGTGTAALLDELIAALACVG